MSAQGETPAPESAGGAPDLESGPPPGQFYRASWTFYLVLAVLGILWIGYSTGDIALSLFIDPQRWWLDVLVGVGAGAALIVAWSVLRQHFAAMRRVEKVMRETTGELEGAEILAVALMSGFAEELFFRGAMQTSWGWPWAVLIFGLLHIGPEPAFRIWTVFALIAGGLFSAITLWSGNILAAIVAHIVVNGVNLWRLLNEPPTEA